MEGMNLLVFRDNAAEVAGRSLGERLIETVNKAARDKDLEAILNALLLAGQVECVLADSGLADEQAQVLTDAIAMMLAREFEETPLDLE